LREYFYSRTSGSIVEGLLVALLIFTPLAFATVQTWAISVMELVCTLMVVVWLIGFALDGARLRLRFPLGLPVILFVGLASAQLFPHLLGGDIASGSDNALLKVATTSVFATKTWFMKLLCYTGLYLCLVNTLTSRRQIARVLVAIVVIGFGVSSLGLLQRVGGTDKVFWLIEMHPKKTGFMATFINENHFAGYMELVIPITMAFVLRYLFRLKKSGWRKLLASDDLYKMIVFSILATVMIVSLAVSRSRGGFVGFVSSLFLITILLVSRRFHRRRAWVIAVVLTLSFLMLAWVGLKDVLREWETLGHIGKEHSFLRRMEITRATWRAAQDYPVWGSGLGTFETVFPKYGTLRFEEDSGARSILVTTPHAENDYVQTLLEMGWLGLSVGLLGAVLFFRIAIVTYLTRRRSSISLPAMGGAVSIFAIMVHSFSDFHFRVDANVFLFVTIVAMVVNLSKAKGDSHYHSKLEKRMP
jgi:O-antigen ligase